MPNPSLNPVQRVRSHSYLHMQETGSLERETESYHSNMFNLEVEDDHNSNKFTDKSENSS